MQTLVIPLTKKISTNAIYAGRHWAVRKKDADFYHNEILHYAKEQKIKKVKEYPISLILIFYFKNRPYDSSNCFYMAKLIEDGLRNAGIIDDDTPKFVEFIGCMSKVDRENPRIEIRIEDK